MALILMPHFLVTRIARIGGFASFACAMVFLISAHHAHASVRSETTPSQSRKSVQDEQILALIRQLGSDDPGERIDAESELLDLGAAALEQLKLAASHRSIVHPDSEIRLRATRLLILIEKSEYEKMIRNFLAGTQDQIALNGWKQFSEIVGSHKQARQLFVAMHESQPKLLKAISAGRQTVEEELQSVIRRSLHVSNYSNSNQVIGTLVSVLFSSSLALESKSGSEPRTAAISDYNVGRIKSVMIQPQMLTFISSAGQKSELGNLASHWLETIPVTDPKMLLLKLEIIKAHQLTGQIDLAVKAMQNAKLTKPARVFALQVIEAIGSEDHLTTLEAMFDDHTIMGEYFVRNNDPAEDNQLQKQAYTIKVQLCDLALAVSVKLAKRNPLDFGFDKSAFKDGRFVANRAGFRDDQVRSVGFQRWKQLRGN